MTGKQCSTNEKCDLDCFQAILVKDVCAAIHWPCRLFISFYFWTYITLSLQSYFYLVWNVVPPGKATKMFRLVLEIFLTRILLKSDINRVVKLLIVHNLNKRLCDQGRLPRLLNKIWVCLCWRLVGRLWSRWLNFPLGEHSQLKLFLHKTQGSKIFNIKSK